VDAETKAVVVQSVLDATPAKAAGLLKGDVLLDVAGAAASDLSTAVAAVRRAKPKSDLVLRVRRDGAEREIKVKVGLLPLVALLGLE
jgi:S1-C subfamily serine protease